MPTLDEALPLIRAAAAAPGGSTVARRDERGAFGAMVTALLSRQVAPSIGRSVVEALGEHGLLDPARLDEAGLPEVQDALRGKVRSISVRTLAPLKNLARWLVERHDGRAESLFDSGSSTDDIREGLAAIRGVGPVGADAILLAALKHRVIPSIAAPIASSCVTAGSTARRPTTTPASWWCTKPAATRTC